MNKKLTLFFGKTNPEFSNLYPAPFTFRGETYASAEHYFMYQKAKLFDPEGEAIQKMGNDYTPKRMKTLGKQVKNYDDAVWADKGRLHMYNAVRAKFMANPALQEKLLETGYSLMGEASPFDRKWGIGLGVSKPGVYDPYQWKGTNWLGAILMAVRGEFRCDTSEIGDRCWYDGDKLFYRSDVQEVEDNLYIYEDEEHTKLIPNWPVIIEGFYNHSFAGHKDIADFERHFIFATILRLGVLEDAYRASFAELDKLWNTND